MPKPTRVPKLHVTPPTYFTVTCKDNFGRVWTFKPVQWYINVIFVESAADVIAFNYQSIRRVKVALDKLPNEFWNRALEDYEHDSDKSFLVKETLTYHKVVSSASVFELSTSKRKPVRHQHFACI